MPDTKEQTDKSGTHGATWVTALTIVAMVALAAFDLTIPDSDVPPIFWGLLVGLAAGAPLDALWHAIKGK